MEKIFSIFFLFFIIFFSPDTGITIGRVSNITVDENLVVVAS